MVEAITQYKAADGSIWPSLTKAEQREKLLAECAKVGDLIGKRTHLAHGTFRQHNMEDFRNFRSALLKLVKKHLKGEWMKEWDSVPEEEVSAFGIIGRILSDSSNLDPIYSLWSRWMCFDRKAREWDQPYFALQADKGTA